MDEMDIFCEHENTSNDEFSSFQAMEIIPQDDKLTYYQVKNNEGGYVYKVTDLTRVLRFLCLGTEKGTYYSKEKELKRENAECIDR